MKRKTGCVTLFLLLIAGLIPAGYLYHVGLKTFALALFGVILLNVVIALVKPRRV